MAYKDYIFYSFKPFSDIEKFIQYGRDNNLPQISDFQRVLNAKRVVGKPYNWYGLNLNSTEPSREQFMFDKGLSRFMDNSLLREAEESYDDIKADIDLGGNILPSRIKFTEKPIGVFDFGQASLGLIRPIEFYCKKTDAIIPKDLVYKEKSKDGSDLFFYKNKEQKIFVQRRQDGTTSILKACSEVVLKQDSLTKIYLPYNKDGEIVNKCKGNRLRYASTNKKVFAFKEKLGGGVAPYVDLYIQTGGNRYETVESMLIRNLPMILLSRILEQAGVKVRIFILFCVNNKRDMNFHYSLLAKNYGESISLNELAIMTADTRFFRWKLQQSLSGFLHKKYGLNYDIWDNCGSINPKIVSDYTMPRLRNYVSKKIMEGQFPSQLVDKSLMLFTGVDSKSTWEMGSDAVKIEVLNKFEEFVNYIAIQFSNNKKKVIQDIAHRLKEKGKTPHEIKTQLNNAVTQILNTTKKFTSLSTESSGIQLQDVDELKRVESNFSNNNISEQMYNIQKDNLIILDTQEEMEDVLASRDELLKIINDTVK